MVPLNLNQNRRLKHLNSKNILHMSLQHKSAIVKFTEQPKFDKTKF